MEYLSNHCRGPTGVQDNCSDAFTGASSALFLLMINSLFDKKCSFLNKRNFPRNVDNDHLRNKTFDFIVVGAGSSGSVVANRLSENRDVRVLLLEAGQYPPSDSQIPSVFPSIQRSPSDWFYRTEKTNTSCMGMQDGRCDWNRGKMMGGTSSMNAMMFIRGNPIDYNEWATINSDRNWSWTNVLRYFKKIENIQYPPLRGPTSNRGQSGPVHTIKYNNSNPMQARLISAYKELGYTMQPDEVPIGLFELTVSIDEAGSRESAGKAYLTDGQHPGDTAGPNSPPNRKNLFLATNAHVMRVLIKDNKANGVQVRVNDEVINIFAGKEVILSAGAINTPQILQLSGIGPKKDLNRLGIPVLKDLPVGQQLMDHFATWGIVLQIDPVASPALTEQQNLENIFDYFSEGKGPYGQVDTVNLGLMNDPYKGSTEAATIQWIPLGFRPNTSSLETFYWNSGLNRATVDDLIKCNQKSVIYSINPILLRPESTGYLELQSKNPFQKPKIHSGYLSNSKDLDVMQAALDFAEKLVNTESLKEVNTTLLRYNLPNCNHLKFWSMQYRECLLRNLGSTIYHPMRTCRMAPENMGGVVDSRLRVYGIKYLRVIDASIMTNPPRGNTNAPCMMIGELASDLIKEDWGYPTDTPP